ncbi:hypothetical protein GLYMA_13G115101v4 [Glycine max]|nr:hypothetical protein GLYMA_13G115101v4 [Glycine max]KAH1100974.1 hypothetical protein GYH30_035876 [Glycine max]
MEIVTKWIRWFLLLCLMLRHVRMASRTCKVGTVIPHLLLLRGIVTSLNFVVMLLPLQNY